MNLADSLSKTTYPGWPVRGIVPLEIPTLPAMEALNHV